MLSHILGMAPPVDVIFLQEVSLLALNVIMETPAVRAGWYSTDMNRTYWDRQAFATITVLSKTRFCADHKETRGNNSLALGRVQRIKY